MSCNHLHKDGDSYHLAWKVGRIEKGFILSVAITCEECGSPFEFFREVDGIERCSLVGVSNDRTEAILMMRPQERVQ